LRLFCVAAFGVACGAVGGEASPPPLSHSAQPAEAEVSSEPEAPRDFGGPCHRLESGPYAARVDAGDGGRIVEFSLNGRNVLVTRDESPVAYGNSFWPSPQGDWDWPPPPELDRLPWQAKSDGGAFVLESQTNVSLGIRARQRLSFDRTSPVFRIEYTLENAGRAPRRLAPWENSRVRPRGLTFYPTNGATLPGSTLELPVIDGVAWLLHDPNTMRENRKSFGDGSEGFLAHVEKDLLFVKVWDDVPRQRQAPGEGEIELYVDKTGLFVEIEEQGPYEELAPGAALVWTVSWLLERLAPGVAVEPGAKTLVEAARRLAQRGRGEKPAR
jgi:hypothetical protein